MFKYILATIRFFIKLLERVHAAREKEIVKLQQIMVKLDKESVRAKRDGTAAIQMAVKLKELVG